MSALVTATPIQVDLVNYSRQALNEINPMGPRLYGATLFLVFITDNPPPQDIWVFSSTDGGNTWTTLDAGHPVADTARFLVSFGTSKIGIVYMSSGQAVITEFTPPATYGSASAGLTLSTGSIVNGSFYQQSTLAYVLVRQNGSGIDYVTFSSGSWGTQTTVVADTSAEVYAGAVDSTDAGHFIYVSGTAINYFRLSSSFVIVGPTSLGTLTVPDFIGSRPTILIWGTNVVCCWIDDNKTLNVSIGTPLSGPSFTNYVIATATGSQHFTYGTVLADKDGNLTVKWVVTDYSGSPVVDQILQSTFDGVSTWGTPILFYDEITNPPPDGITPETDQFIHTMDGLQLANGSWVIATAMETPFFCTGFVLVSPGTSSPLSLACPVDGGAATIGVPYDKTLVPSGGTGPYTFRVVS